MKQDCVKPQAIIYKQFCKEFLKKLSNDISATQDAKHNMLNRFDRYLKLTKFFQIILLSGS